MPKKKDSEINPEEHEEMLPDEMSSQDVETGSGEPDADVTVEDHGDVSIQREVSESNDGIDLSPDDLLDDVRRSLISETEEKEDVESSKWWKKIGKTSRKKKEDVAEQLPQQADITVEPAVIETEKQVEYVGQLDELIDMLEGESESGIDASSDDVDVVQTEDAEVEEEQKVPDLKELKERAFHSRGTSGEEERSISEVRSIALDDGEDVFIEVEARTEDAVQDRMKAIENAFMPYRKYFTFIFVFVSLVMVVLVSASLFRLYQRSLPPPPTEEAALLPYPIGMNLPGGLNFNLGKGKIQDGRWDPRGPEWLEGTEVCRWIAIPHSRQLEAVVRTLTREDQIELIMSNNDVLTYTVNSIDQLTLEEMQRLDANTPCMLLVLAQADTDERWVVTAIP